MPKNKKSLPAYYVGLIMFALGLFVATLLNKGPLSGEQASTAEQPSGLFQLQSRNYNAEDLSYSAASALYQLEQDHFERKQALLHVAALNTHLDNLAAKRGVSRALIRDELIPTPSVGEAEAARFYQENQEHISKPYHEVKDAIIAALQRKQENQGNRELINGLLEAGQLSLTIKAPTPPTVELDTEGFPALGPESAPVVVTEFADYKCPHCKTASKTLTDLQKEHPEKIRLVFIDLPILGKTSKHATKAALCAQQQGAYWPMHEALFAHQPELTTEKINTLASTLALNTNDFNACLASQNDHAMVTRATEQAQKLGIRSTPSIFINGIAFRGHNLEASLRDSVMEALNTPTP